MPSYRMKSAAARDCLAPVGGGLHDAGRQPLHPSRGVRPDLDAHLGRARPPPSQRGRRGKRGSAFGRRRRLRRARHALGRAAPQEQRTRPGKRHPPRRRRHVSAATAAGSAFTGRCSGSQVRQGLDRDSEHLRQLGGRPLRGHRRRRRHRRRHR